MDFEKAVMRFEEMVIGRRIEGIHWLNNSVSVLLEGGISLDAWDGAVGAYDHKTDESYAIHLEEDGREFTFWSAGSLASGDKFFQVLPSEMASSKTRKKNEE